MRGASCVGGGMGYPLLPVMVHVPVVVRREPRCLALLARGPARFVPNMLAREPARFDRLLLKA
jgi:hypothetical protein